MDFFLIMEAPCVVDWPLLEFFEFVLGWRWLAPFKLESWLTCRFSWPSSEFNFLVLDSTFWRMISSRSSVSTLVSASRRFLVASVDSSSVLVVWSFLGKYLSLSPPCDRNKLSPDGRKCLIVGLYLVGNYRVV